MNSGGFHAGNGDAGNGDAGNEDAGNEDAGNEDRRELAQAFDRFARFYDADYRAYDEDIPLIVEFAESSGGAVLELGCGTGRLLGPLAAAGIRATGVDISPGLLGVARAKLRRAIDARQVTLHEADLRTFLPPTSKPGQKAEVAPGPFSFAFCVSNTLMHLSTPQDQLAVLENTARRLTPGGVLLIDLFNPDIPRLLEVNGIMELADQWNDPDTGAEVLKWSVRVVDLAEQLQDTTFIYEEIFEDGQSRKTVCPFLLRYLWRNEAELMLARAGFTTRAVWGDLEGGDYHSAAERLVLIAEKD